MLVSNKKYKKLIGIVMLIFCILAFYNPTFAVVSPTSDFYVNDYANVLTEQTKQYIKSMNIALNNQTKAQIVVVTVESLDGKEIEEYATELFRKFGIGDKEKNNGVLLLCSTGDRMFRVEVGYGLEGILPDGKTGRIQDEYIIPYLKNNNYDEGIKNGFNAILKEVANEYQVEITGAQEAEAKQSDENSEIDLSMLIFGAIVISRIVRKATEGKKNKKTLRIIYVIITGILVFLIIPFLKIMTSIIITIINLICVFSKGNSGFYGGGRIFFRWKRIFRRFLRRRIFWWWIFRRRRKLWWRRKF